VYNQKAFLKTFLTDGQIQEMFKILDNPLKTIQEHDTESLKKVHGVGDYISNCIIERFEDNKDYCSVYLELDDLGLTPKFIQKLISKYKNPNVIIKIVKENPYQLSYDVEGIGFKTADDIALACGISEKSPQRVKAYINYILNDLGANGNSFISSGELTAYIFEQFNGKDNILEAYIDDEGNVTGNNIGQAIEELQNERIIIVEENENRSQRRIYLQKYWELEKAIADNIKRISQSDNLFKYDDWEFVVSQLEEKQGWNFTQEQIQGIKLGLDKQVCFITGGAGTGKSSLVSGILESLKDYSFAQTALAGKASARLQEVTGKEGLTIHRLLGFKPPNDFAINEENPLDYNIIILDEISLVGGEIFLSLIKAIPDGCKLIILGDMGQLESIGCLNLAHDLYKCQYVTVVELQEIHRQAKRSGITLASQQIRKGDTLFKRNFTGIEIIGELEDMCFDVNDTSEHTRSKAIEYFKQYYESDLVNDVLDIQILAPVKERGDASVQNLNSDIQSYLNPQKPFKKEIKIEYSKDKCFFLREGDKIMCTRNNYKLFNIKDSITEVFNGWTGILEEIDVYSETATIYFPIIKDRIIFPFSEVRKSIMLGYASTVHKYQGSSAKVVISVLDYTTPPNMRTRELVYTMLTRAEKKGVLVAQNKALDDAIHVSGISNKNTFLIELLDKTEVVQTNYK